MSGLNNIVSFDEGDRWFVLYTGRVDKNDYSYLVKLDGDEPTDEYKLFKSEYSLGDEYMDEVIDNDEKKKVLSSLIPEIKEYIDNPDKIKELIETS